MVCIVHLYNLYIYDICDVDGPQNARRHFVFIKITIKKNCILIRFDRCQEVYGEHVNIHEGHLCGGALNGKGGTCVGNCKRTKKSQRILCSLKLYFCHLGDSGGPLNCRLHKNGPWVLAGITSFGSGCSSDGAYNPDVFIRISYYIKWIVKTMSSN